MNEAAMTPAQILVAQLFRDGKTNAEIGTITKQSTKAVSAMLNYINKAHGLNLKRKTHPEYRNNNQFSWAPSKEQRFTVRGKSTDGASHSVTADSLHQAESMLAGMLA